MTDAALITCNLVAGYGGRAILNRLDLTIPRGQFSVLLGANGCGKSTLLRTIAGLQPALSGEVWLEGQRTTALPAKMLARRMSVLTQGAQAPEGLTVEALVRQGRYPHRSLLGGWSAVDARAVDSALALTQMTGLRAELLENLSGGQKQRAWIAMTLAQEGEVLLLDEPTSYLDLAHQLDVLSLVRNLITERQITVVAVLHDLNQAARFADHVILLRDGRIHAAGEPRAVLTCRNVREVFGVSVGIWPDPETGTVMCVPKQDHRAAS